MRSGSAFARSGIDSGSSSQRIADPSSKDGERWPTRTPAGR
jgi:hypothetical protein